MRILSQAATGMPSSRWLVKARATFGAAPSWLKSVYAESSTAYSRPLSRERECVHGVSPAPLRKHAPLETYAGYDSPRYALLRCRPWKRFSKFSTKPREC